MAINPYLLCEALPAHTMKKINSSRYRCSLSYVTIYKTGIKADEKTIYLIPEEAEWSGEFPDKGTWIARESLAKTMIHTKADVIGMPEQYPLQKVYDQVCHIIDIYNQWERTMKQALSDGCDAHELCKIGVPFMGNPMMITTDDGEILGVGLIRGDDYSKQLREQETDYLNKQRIQKVYRNAMQFLEQKEPIFYYLDEEAPTLMYNLFVEEGHKGILYVDAWNKQFNDGDYTRICIFGTYLEIYMKLLLTTSYKPLNRFRKELSQLVSYQKGDKKVITYYLQQFGWKENDTYLCGVISEIGEAESMKADSICREYEQTLKESGITFRDSQIYLICNMSCRKESKEVMISKIAKINEKYHVSLGVSTAFAGFFACQKYFMQAKAAYEIGHIKRETDFVYEFDDYRLLYLVHQGVGKLPFEVEMPEKLKQIYEYDKQMGSEYFETLGMYFWCNQNVSKTAERLFMHRSTLRYRLKKIEAFVGREVFEDRGLGLICAMLYRYRKFTKEKKGESDGD